MAESVLVTRTAGIGVEGIQDQYADGKAAQVWDMLVGSAHELRTRHYKNILVSLLKKHGCKRILDVACGTGVDSVMLLEEGFEVISIDASDKMLKHAFKKRWERRKEPAFDNWVIEEANWLTLTNDLKDIIGEGFDALICLGNSFAHLADHSGDQSKQRQAISNFESCIRPGGLLLIDHRNFDDMLSASSIPRESIYYMKLQDLTTSTLYTAGKPILMILDYKLNVKDFESETKTLRRTEDLPATVDFRLSYYPHRLENFTKMLDDAFPNSKHTVLSDWTENVENPGFYIHIIEKTSRK